MGESIISLLFKLSGSLHVLFEMLLIMYHRAEMPFILYLSLYAFISFPISIKFIQQ